MRSVNLALILILVFISCDNSPPEFNKKRECPVRIASMSLASDEILLDIIDDNRLIGVTYLAENKNLSNVYLKAGSVPNQLRPNLEQILQLQPDIVILADYIDFGFLNQVQKSGINILLLKDFNSLNGIKANIAKIGDAVCEKEKTETIPQSSICPYKIFTRKSTFKIFRFIC